MIEVCMERIHPIRFLYNKEYGISVFFKTDAAKPVSKNSQIFEI